MTIDEAIKVLESARYLKQQYQLPGWLDAHELAIEALKRLKEYREWHRSTGDDPLPGETEE